MYLVDNMLLIATTRKKKKYTNYFSPVDSQVLVVAASYRYIQSKNVVRGWIKKFGNYRRIYFNIRRNFIKLEQSTKLSFSYFAMVLD